ncbi:MAG: PAS domain S-box protein [Planctomycetota bacterium]
MTTVPLPVTPMSVPQILPSQARDGGISLILNALGVGSWVWYRDPGGDVHDDQVDYDDRWFAMLGYEKAAFPPVLSSWAGLCHPADREATLTQVLAELDAGDDRFMAEYRIRSEAGEWRWHRANGAVTVRDDDGRAAIIVGTSVDVTDEKNALQKLRQSEERFRGSFEQSTVGTCLIGLDGQFRQVNDAYCDLLGYSAEELIGKKLQSITHADDVGMSERNLAMFLGRTGGGRTWEKRLLRSDGVPVNVLCGVTLLRDDTGRPREILAQVQDLTDRIQAESDLAASEQRFRDIAEAAGEYLWETDADCRFRFVTSPVERSLGLPAEEVIGRTPFDFVPVEDLDRLRSKVANAFASGASIKGLEHRVVADDGSTRWQRINGMPLFDDAGEVVGYRGAALDITDEKQSAEELRCGEERLRSFIENTPAAVAMFDTEMRYLAHSRQFLTDYGLPDESLVGRWHNDVFPDLKPEWDANHARVIRDGVVLAAEDDRFEREDGSVDWITWALHPWRAADGEIGGLIMYTRVTTDTKRRQEELRIAREQAEEADRAKSRFLANMSHELRTPLTAMLGFTELLGDRHDPEMIQEFVETIRRNGRHLLQLVNDILDLSKIEADKLEVDLTTVRLEPLVREVVDSVRPDAVGSDDAVTLDVEVAPDVPAGVHTDAFRLRQILINLVGNAVKFTDRGAVTVEVSRRVGRGGDEVAFSVRDTGIGISSDALARVFEPFRQADSSTSRRHGGTGLGLAICRRLAERLGGRIEAQSRPGEGSCFTLLLPAAASFDHGEPAAAGPIAPAQAVPTASRLDRRPLEVLVTDDAADNRRLVKFLLEKAGCVVDLAENGAVACERVAAREIPYDLVLMDMQMPEVDGYTATERLRAGGYDAPIVALTAHAMRGDRERCLAAGCDEYMTKPIERLSLTALVEKVRNGGVRLPA